MFVSASGNVALTGDYLMNDAIGAEMKYYVVRPVMWLDLSNNDVWGYAGKTASDGNVYSDDIPTPTPLPTNIPTQSPQQDLTVTPSVVPSAPVPTPVKQPDITVQADTLVRGSTPCCMSPGQSCVRELTALPEHLPNREGA